MHFHRHLIEYGDKDALPLLEKDLVFYLEAQRFKVFYFVTNMVTHPNSPDHDSHITTTVKVASEYPHTTLNGTPTSNSLSGTALYEVYVAGQGESGCVIRE